MRTAHLISAAVFRQTGYSGNHPLAIARVGTVERLCAALGWFGPGHRPNETPLASFDTLARFHDPDYLRAIQRAEAAGRASDADRDRHAIGTLENPIFTGLWERAAASVGGQSLPRNWRIAVRWRFIPAAAPITASLTVPAAFVS